jgi:hypothetical protein
LGINNIVLDCGIKKAQLLSFDDLSMTPSTYKLNWPREDEKVVKVCNADQIEGSQNKWALPPVLSISFEKRSEDPFFVSSVFVSKIYIDSANELTHRITVQKGVVVIASFKRTKKIVGSNPYS